LTILYLVCYLRGMRIKINELAENSGFSRRAIRYYISSGQLPAPIGKGRGSYYTEKHLAMLKEISSLRKKHLKPSKIGQTWSRYVVNPNLEVHVKNTVKLSKKKLKIQRFLEILREFWDEEE
jgi:DNA-binding transcriptional MerR regulator